MRRQQLLPVEGNLIKYEGNFYIIKKVIKKDNVVLPYYLIHKFDGNDDDNDSDNDDVKINKHEIVEQKHEIIEQVYFKNVKEVENEFPSLSKKTIKQQAPVIHFATVAKNAQYLPVPEVKILPIKKETFDDYDDDSDNNDDDDYTPYVPDDSFDNYDPYERPAHAFKYYTEEHELQANIVSNRRIIVEDDDNW